MSAAAAPHLLGAVSEALAARELAAMPKPTAEPRIPRAAGRSARMAGMLVAR
jgi:hypothetical protein